MHHLSSAKPELERKGGGGGGGYTPCKCRRGGPQLEPLNYYNSVVLAWNLGTFSQARNTSLTICRTRTLEKGWGVHSHHVSVGGAVLAP